MPRTISKIIKFAGEPRRERFNLYLLNHTFPDSSGVTVCEDLRKFDAETPILFYSARAIPLEKEAAIRAGAQDYLIKPERPLQRRGARRQVDRRRTGAAARTIIKPSGQPSALQDW